MDSLLRDIQREREKMQSDINNLNRHQEKQQEYINIYVAQAVREWCKLIIDHPKAVILIVETTPIIEQTGYNAGENEPIRFTAYNMASETIMLDQLIDPSYSVEVRSEYHGILKSDLVQEPRIDDIWQSIEQQLEGNHIVIFGQTWACRAMRTVHQTDLLDKAYCLHNKCKEYYGEFYNLSLEKILQYQGINKKREELRDSRERIIMLAQVIRNMAAGMIKICPESEEPNDKLDEHPF